MVNAPLQKQALDPGHTSPFVYPEMDKPRVGFVCFPSLVAVFSRKIQEFLALWMSMSNAIGNGDKLFRTYCCYSLCSACTPEWRWKILLCTRSPFGVLHVQTLPCSIDLWLRSWCLCALLN